VGIELEEFLEEVVRVEGGVAAVVHLSAVGEAYADRLDTVSSMSVKFRREYKEKDVRGRERGG
jgi:hypothetical protein